MTWEIALRASGVQDRRDSSAEAMQVSSEAESSMIFSRPLFRSSELITGKKDDCDERSKWHPSWALPAYQ